MGRGGGGWAYIAGMNLWRATSNMLAFLYPWMLGSGVPVRGVPVGRVTRQVTGTREAVLGAALGCDPWSWYKARIISVPSAFILGLPGLGKSSLLRRWILGLDYFGVTSLVLGDLKGEHVKLVRALGGQVIPIGRGRGYINVLDMGSVPDAVQRLRAASVEVDHEAQALLTASGRYVDGGLLVDMFAAAYRPLQDRVSELATAAEQLLATARARRQAAVETLLRLQRRAALGAKETAVLAAALDRLDQAVTDRTPIIEDLWDVVEAPTADLHAAAQSYGDLNRYLQICDELLGNLRSLSQGHGLGAVFSQETSVRLDVNRHAVFDVSGLDDTDDAMRAAALMLSWAIGFGEIATENMLAAVGLAEQRQWFVVMDELWRALRAAPGLPQMVDSLTRLDRDKGVARAFASHTMDDLAALQDEADRRAAAGFVERSGMVVIFGCPASELPRLQSAVRLTQVEQDTLTSWTTPPTLNPESTVDQPWPGRGKFLVKVGARAGIPVEMEFSPTEAALKLHDTAQKWTETVAA